MLTARLMLIPYPHLGAALESKNGGYVAFRIQPAPVRYTARLGYVVATFPGQKRIGGYPSTHGDSSRAVQGLVRKLAWASIYLTYW